MGSIINQYNTMLIERKRLLRTSSENNPAVININTGIESMRHNVQTTVNSVLRGLQIAQSNLERQARKFEGRISSAPQQEKRISYYLPPAGNQGDPLHYVASEA